jgi:non-haem Fe2+, alpha-ketoglutarate-dependent halogenase
MGQWSRSPKPQARSDPHRDTFAKHNLLTRGEEVMVEVDHSRRRVITLHPGELSLHHVRLVHGSPPNPSNDRRIGFGRRP